MSCLLLFRYLLINSFIFYKQIKSDKKLTSKGYHLEMCTGLLEHLHMNRNKNWMATQTPNKRKRVNHFDSMIPQVNEKEAELERRYPMRLVDVGTHVPQYSVENRMCKICYHRYAIKYYSHFYCQMCDICLCLNKNRSCYEDFHCLNHL